MSLRAAGMAERWDWNPDPAWPQRCWRSLPVRESVLAGQFTRIDESLCPPEALWEALASAQPSQPQRWAGSIDIAIVTDEGTLTPPSGGGVLTSSPPALAAPATTSTSATAPTGAAFLPASGPTLSAATS